MYSLIRSLLFKLDPEIAHALALKALSFYPRVTINSVHPVKAMGLTFAHPVGLAAGLDKTGSYISGLDKLGFSFLEVGTVTPRAQIGNPKPRLFRIPEAHAIINRMGFNNSGVDALVTTLQKSSFKGILGINIGKNKDTSLNFAAQDYLYCMEKIYPFASYITINISSPNTPDLRQLQQDEYLDNILNIMVEAQKKLQHLTDREVPLVLKVSPDESHETLKKITATVLKYQIAGIIVSNTTCARPDIESLAVSQEAGGLSGKPLWSRSTAALKTLKSEAGNAVTLIGVGGISSVEDAQLKLSAGADLLQLYTGLIYQGPQLIKKIVTHLENEVNL